MSIRRGKARAPRFAVWAPGGPLVTSTTMRDVISINGGVRSIDLAFTDPPVLVRSRFRASRHFEREEEEAFEDDALSHFARRTPVALPPNRPRSLSVMLDGSIKSAPLRLSTVICASLTLGEIGMPESAVDIAWAFLPSEPFRLERVDEPELDRLLEAVTWPDQEHRI